MGHERRPLRRPAEIPHQLARQAERKVEAADPGAGPAKQRFEFPEVLQFFYLFNTQKTLVEQTVGDGDRLRAARRRGEVHAEDSHGLFSVTQTMAS